MNEEIHKTEDTVKPLNESIVSRIGFWQGLVVSGISIATTIIVISAFFSGSLSRLSQVEKDMESRANEIRSVRTDLDSRLQRIEQNMVNKEDFKELKTDVKELVRRK